jgi:MYXO-CTERM domain-containing protein
MSLVMSNRAISTSLSAFALAFGLLVVSNVAVAAPPPTTGGDAGPEQEACSGRVVGDACTLPNRALGTCGQGTCNRLDYSGGSPPKAIEEACVVCQASPGHGNGPALGTGGAPSESAGDGADAPSSGGSSSDSPTKEPPQSESRCRIDSTREPVGLAGLAALLLLAGVRRRRA